MVAKQACTNCGFTHQCLCDAIPYIDSDIQLALLTHSNELTRDTNTGKLLVQTLSQCEVFEWQRKDPPQALIERINNPDHQAYVVYPNDHSLPVSDIVASHISDHEKTPLFIILDGTWQEAKKMFNKSDWLKALPSVHLQVGQVSNYQLRRNQEAGHLCTCEVGGQLLTELGQHDQAEQLSQYFEHYLKVFKADKCGHSLL